MSYEGRELLEDQPVLEATLTRLGIPHQFTTERALDHYSYSSIRGSQPQYHTVPHLVLGAGVWLKPLNINGEYYRGYRAPFSMLLSAYEVIHEYGFAISAMSNRHVWALRADLDNYIKIELETSEHQKDIIFPHVWVKDQFNKYQPHACPFTTWGVNYALSQGDIDQMKAYLADLITIPKPKYQRRTVELGEPHGFAPVDFRVCQDIWGKVCAPTPTSMYLPMKTNTIGVRVLGITGVNANRVLVGCDDPTKTELWFHLDCYNNPTSFQIITDGDRWYLVKSSGGKLRAVPDRHRTPNFEVQLNTADQELITFAIKSYSNLTAAPQ